MAYRRKSRSRRAYRKKYKSFRKKFRRAKKYFNIFKKRKAVKTRGLYDAPLLPIPGIHEAPRSSKEWAAAAAVLTTLAGLSRYAI
jgi:hypothetical protein